MKKIISAVVITALTITNSTPVIAASAKPVSIVSKAEERIPIIVDNMEIACDQSPVIIEDRVLVPLRAIFEALGAEVHWNNDERSVIAMRSDITVSLTIGSTTLYKNGKPIYIDVPAQIINNKTLVPVRAVSESFGADVEWDSIARVVKIFTNSGEIPDEGTPSEPENPDVDEPTEPDDPAIKPGNPEVKPPEEEQPSIDEQEKNVKYNDALLNLRYGYSYEAYYAFKDLADYKDSNTLMQQAYWLNQLSYNATRLQYQDFYEQRESYPILTEAEITQLMPTTTWLQPGLQYIGGAYLNFNYDGTGRYKMVATDYGPDQIMWTVENNGLFWVTTYFTDNYGNQHATNSQLITDGCEKEFRKVTDGVYADIDLIGHAISGPMPCNETKFYVDANTNIGNGLIAYWNRVASGISPGMVSQDENGLFYEE